MHLSATVESRGRGCVEYVMLQQHLHDIIIGVIPYELKPYILLYASFFLC